jgi:hypothetical protein
MTTEAGKRWMQTPAAQVVTGMGEAVAAIEAEAEHRGYLRANDCDHSPCIESEAEAFAAERARIKVAVEGRMVTRTRPAEHEWSRGFRDGWNDAIGTALRIIEGETDD